VVGLCLSDEAPASAAERFAVARKMYEMVTAAGLPAADLWVDPLVLTVSADSAAGLVTMGTLRMVKEQLDCRTIGGLSNVSFGLPNRPLLNRTFVAMCMACIDGAVLDAQHGHAGHRRPGALRRRGPLLRQLPWRTAGLLNRRRSSHGRVAVAHSRLPRARLRV
jgi:cobalamin-dependent methionine synthase I